MKTLKWASLIRKRVSYIGINLADWDEADPRFGDFVSGEGMCRRCTSTPDGPGLFVIQVQHDDGTELWVDAVEVRLDSEYEPIERTQIQQRDLAVNSFTHVDVLLNKKENKLAVVFTEPTWNRGRSVTNSIEYLVKTFCKTYKLPFDEIDFYERYESSPDKLDKIKGKLGFLWERVKPEEAEPILDCIKSLEEKSK